MRETIVTIETPANARRPFCAGIVARNGRVIEVASILYRHIKRGWNGQQVADYCRSKGWKWESVVTLDDGKTE